MTLSQKRGYIFRVRGLLFTLAGAASIAAPSGGAENYAKRTNVGVYRLMSHAKLRLALVTAPTLVLVGNQDILTPRGDSEEIADRMPNAELVVISGAAHGFMVEHASTFNRVLLEFLGRVTRAQRAAAVADAAAVAAAS